MRPSTAISADGPANLLEAVTLAGLPDAKNRGAMLAFNDRIGAALYTQKTHANFVDTFKAPEQGFIGGFLDNKPFFYYPAAQPTFKETFDISNVTELPMVDVLYGSQSFDYKLIGAAVENGAKGIVIAGTGAGSLSDLTIIEVEKWLAQGFPIVASTKM
jgi:L-asparaginase